MDMDRRIVKKLSKEEGGGDEYEDLEICELISMIWEITKDVWSFVGGEDVKRRLQRNVATVTRRAS